ncbi:putative conserved membrane protein [Synechococcus sp. A15-62]|nr:putative conserved membrane protein [Synechococcus sp. A15-62]
MQLSGLESPVLIIASLLIALQVCWIESVLRRNQRRLLGEPLSAAAFQRELQRIFSRANGLS